MLDKSITDNGSSLTDRQSNIMDRELNLTEYERQVRLAHGLNSEDGSQVDGIRETSKTGVPA